MALRCPICGKEVPPRPGNAAWPFCCERCRLLDLGQWIDEDYRVPAENQEHDETGSGEPSTVGGDGDRDR